MLNNFDLNSIKSLMFQKHRPNTIRIYDIKSKQARNFLRGIDPESHASISNALDKIKKISDLNDYKNSILYIRTHPFFESSPIGQLLNNFIPQTLKNSPEFSLKEIIEQINNYNNELCVIAECAINIANKLEKSEYVSALEACEELITQKGASIYLLRVIAYITNRYHLYTLEDKIIPSKIETIKKTLNITTNNFIDESISHLSNLRTSHLAICKRIFDLPNEFNKGYIAKSFISPIPSDYNDFIKTLNAFYSHSLFDAFLYYQNTVRLNLPFIIKGHINNDLLAIFNEFVKVEFLPEKIYPKIDEDTGHYYYRECFLFIEQMPALKYSVIHGSYYTSFGVTKKITPYAKTLVNEYFKNLTSLSQLRCEPMLDIKVGIENYDPKTCGMLENSSALIYLLNNNEGRLEEDEKLRFVELMSYSRNIGEICPPDYLEVIADEAEDRLLKLVSQCLITINRKNQYTEHQLRKTIQDFSIESFDSNLLNLLKYLYQVSPAVTEHLIVISNESFLSTLFHLTDKPIDALNLRADMLNWYGDVTSDTRFKDRAKTLKIDIQLNKEKGTIDDSRIYVDPFKYQQWLEDNMISKLTTVLDTLLRSTYGSLIKLDWNTKVNSVSSGEELLEYLRDCYREFCENKVFGIGSYLGRRIRHGTFKGTAITELQKLPVKAEYKMLFEDKDFKRKFDEWIIRYENMIEELVKTSLQIKSKKKPFGLITTEVDSNQKNDVANQLVYEILSMHKQPIGVIRLPNLIIDYCWRLVEFDLHKTKKLLSEKKSTYGVFSYTPRNQSAYMKRSFSRFTQEVNSLTGQKFALMASWFNKPNYASPSADIYLLFNAVISEVKDSVNNFDPVIDHSDRIFTINGGSYYIIYDALYVLIHNAARHGKPNGKIHFEVEKSQLRNAIHISLTTELDSAHEIRLASNRIQLHLDASDSDSSFIDDAHIVEGNSGMKKLRKLEKEGSIRNFKFMTNENALLLCFEFDFELDLREKINASHS